MIKQNDITKNSKVNKLCHDIQHQVEDTERRAGDKSYPACGGSSRRYGTYNSSPSRINHT